MPSLDHDKVRENRVRRQAKRRGYRLVKSKCRDPLSIAFGSWLVVDAYSNVIMAGGHGVMTLQDVETFLTSDGDDD